MICIYENLLVFAYFLINGRFCLISFGNSTFSNISPRAKHVLNTWIMNAMCKFVSFRYILFICSCYLGKHLSQCELFWYPSPDDGYWNRNIQYQLYIIINSPIWIMFFCYLHLYILDEKIFINLKMIFFFSNTPHPSNWLSLMSYKKN